MMSEASPRKPDPLVIARWRRRVQAPPWLHEEIGRRMAERLDWIKRTPRTWCDWFASTDGAAAEVSRRYPQAARMVVEPTAFEPSTGGSPERGLPNWLSRWWKRSEEPGYDPSSVPAGSAELIWSNMNLHFSTDPALDMAAWHRALRPDGFVMFSCFGPDTLRELRSIYRELGWGPVTVDFADMHDLGDMLVTSGFADPVMDMEHLTLRWPSAKAMLTELRTLGANASIARFDGLRTPGWQLGLEHAIESRADAGQCTQTFEIVYGHAFKVGSGVPLATESSIALDDMRALLRRR